MNAVAPSQRDVGGSRPAAVQLQGVAVERLFGIPVHACTMAEAVAACDRAIAARERLTIGVVNAAKIVHLRHDPELRQAVLSCDLILADGQAVVWASRLLRRPLPERVAGIDLFTELLAQAETKGQRVYFLGGTRQVLADMLGRLRRTHPRLDVAGTQDGYFPPESAGRVAEQIRQADVDLLFVGMSSPGKERFLDGWGTQTRARVLHGVGGSFDVLSGKTRRAPARWQRLGLEWLYRLLQEPGRLWRRYLVTNVQFLLLTALELVRPQPAYARPVPSATRTVVVRTPGSIDLHIPAPRTPTTIDLDAAPPTHPQESRS